MATPFLRRAAADLIEHKLCIFPAIPNLVHNIRCTKESRNRVGSVRTKRAVFVFRSLFFFFLSAHGDGFEIAANFLPLLPAK